MPATKANAPSGDRIRTRSLARADDKPIKDTNPAGALPAGDQTATRPRTRSVAKAENAPEAAPALVRAGARRGRTAPTAAALRGATKAQAVPKRGTATAKGGTKSRSNATKSRTTGATQTRGRPQKRSEASVQVVPDEPRAINWDHRHRVMEELRESLVAADEGYAKDMYSRFASDSKIRNAFKKIGYSPRKKYSAGAGRWNLVPDEAASDKELCGVFVEIANTVIKHLAQPDAQGTRTAKDTYSERFAHAEDPSQHSSPCITIMATGSSFESPDGKEKACYKNAASCFEVTRESTEEDPELIVQQHGIYARQIFMYQPNRKFVRTMALTEHNPRLLHFDRSGAKYSASINIHKDPCTFVRLILGLASSNEEDLGLDTSIQWVIGEDGRKASGFIKMVDRDNDNEELIFELADPLPVFHRSALCGRATTCWSAFNCKADADGHRVKVIIKDSWRTHDRAPEHICLEKVKGLDGVIQMLYHEDFRAETQEPAFRGVDAADDGDFTNRIWLRVVTEQLGGQPFDRFTSQKQAIAALRDVLLTHRDMIKFKQVLHRDVSMQNILLGSAPEDHPFTGLGAVLIDLDMAIQVSPRGESNITCDSGFGVRRYQSCSVLSSYPWKNPYHTPYAIPTQSYVDDLESFFFITAHLMFGWAGVRQEVEPYFLRRWDSADPVESLRAKRRFLSAWDFTPELIPAFWETPCRDLLESFRSFIEDLSLRKKEANDVYNPEKRRQGLEKLHAGFEDHYQQVESMFDTALKELGELEEARLKEARPALAPVQRPANVPPAPRAPRKRGIDSGDEQAEPDTPCKRTRATARKV